MTLLLPFVAASTFISFILAAVFFFKKNDVFSPWIAALKTGALASAILQVTWLWKFPTPVLGQQYGSVALYMASLGLFLWTLSYARKRRLTEIFSSDTPAHLFSQGPYRFVRHPFYGSYMLAYLAGCLGAPSVTLALQTIAMGMLYLRAALFEEAKFERSELSSTYRDYRNRVGMFFPKFR